MKFGVQGKTRSSSPPSPWLQIPVAHAPSCLPRSGHSGRSHPSPISVPPQMSLLWLWPTPHPAWEAPIGTPSPRHPGQSPCLPPSPSCYSTVCKYQFTFLKKYLQQFYHSCFLWILRHIHFAMPKLWEKNFKIHKILQNSTFIFIHVQVFAPIMLVRCSHHARKTPSLILAM